jgi:hypothetical protein
MTLCKATNFEQDFVALRDIVPLHVNLTMKFRRLVANFTLMTYLGFFLHEALESTSPIRQSLHRVDDSMIMDSRSWPLARRNHVQRREPTAAGMG